MAIKTTLISLVCGLSIAGTSVLVPQEQQAGETAKVRVGVFDSRAIAIAWANSDMNREHHKAIREEYDRAKAEGNQARVEQINAEMEARQDVLHKQGFSIWPVDDILEHIEDELESIAEQAGVDIIVCKWDVTYQSPGVKLKNVTREMSEPFDPDERAWNWIEDIQAKDPVSLDVLEASDH